MLTLLVFAVLTGVAVVATILVRRSPVTQRALSSAAGIIGWPVIALCGLVARIAGLVLGSRESDDHVTAWRYVVWAALCLLPLAAFFADVRWPLPLPPAADPGYLLIVGALIPLLAIGAAYLVVRDDFDVMEGVGAGARRIGSGRAIARAAAIAVAVALVVAYSAALAWWLAEADGFPLFVVRPATGVPIVDYLLVALRVLPTDYVVALIDRITGENTAAMFGPSLVAQAFFFVVRGVGALVALVVATIAIQHAWQLRRIVTEIGERDERDERRGDLIARAIAAPPSIKRGILRAAVTRSDVEKQKRLIVAAKEMGLIGLPENFCRFVEGFDSEIQSFGLDQCLEMFRHRSRDFAAAPSSRALAEAARVLARGRLGTEPTKKLLRLMTSIVVIKRGVVEPDDQQRTGIEASIKAELEKPRAREDAALRGFLRDLQSALNGAQAGGRLMSIPERRDEPSARRPTVVPKPAPPVPEAEPVVVVATPAAAASVEEIRPSPEAEDPAAVPDSPPPTVH